MGNLQKQSTLSPWQLGIIIVMSGIGAGIVTSTHVLFASAGQIAWLVPCIAGWGYFGVAYLIIKLGELFPDETFAAYWQRLWGRRVASLLIWFFIIAMLIRMSLMLQIFSREITFFMFDRTPMEVIILTLLGVGAYCALQDFETTLSMTQILFFTVLPMLISIILLGFVNFQLINVYPLWPVNIAGIIKASQECWRYYVGYEFMLWLLPLVNRSKGSVTKAVGGAFLLKTMLMMVAMLMALGVMSLEGIKGAPYPVALSIRSIELPGTFVERIDNYMFLAWIPLAFINLVLPMFIIANIVTEFYGYSDHRPFVLLLVPVLFVGGMSLHDLSVFSVLSGLGYWPGLLFSFGIIPATCFLAYRKKQKQKAAAP